MESRHRVAINNALHHCLWSKEISAHRDELIHSYVCLTLGKLAVTDIIKSFLYEKIFLVKIELLQN